MRLPLLTSTLILSACAAALASDAPQTAPRFQPCIWPNPCGAKGSAPIQPPAEEPKPAPKPDKEKEGRQERGTGADPLQAKILEGRLRGEGGIVSAMRIQENGVERIIYQGAGLQGAVSLAALGPSVGLPESSLKTSGTRFEICQWPKKCGDKDGEGAKGKVASEKQAAKQLNTMPQRPADRMWESAKR